MMLGLTTPSTRYASMPQICPKGKLLNTPTALHHKGALRPTPSSSPLCQVPHSRRASTAAHASVLLGQHAPHETSPAHHFNTLLNKKLSLNPFATFSDWISRHSLTLDLGLAASSADSLPSSVGLAAASGAFIATNCDAVSIVLRGVFSNPTALFLQDVLDPLPGSIVALVLAVAAAFVGLWQLRGWWAAQMLMATPSSQPRASSSSSSNSSSGSHTFEAEAPHPTWQGTLLGLGRLGCIIWVAQALAGRANVASAAAAYALSLLLLGPIASTITAALAPAISSTLPGTSRGASSTAPQPAPVQQQQPQQQQQQQEQQQQQQQQTRQGEEGSSEQQAANASSSQPSPPSSPPANASASSSTQAHPSPLSTSSSVPAPVLALLGAEVAFLVLQLEQLPVAAVAICGLAVAGLTAAAQRMPDMQQRLEPHKVAVGDLVAVHLSLALENGIVIDSTHGGQPLYFRVGSAREDLGLQLEEEEPEPSTSSSESSSMAPEAESESLQGGPGASASATAPSSIDTIGRQRFMQLVPAADAALQGSLRGTRTSFSIFNPSFEEGGFVNPELVWSQPRDEAKRKFGGLVPIPGQVFMYPIGGHSRPHDWVPVMVTGVDDKAVHLDANYSVEGTAALVHIDVQSLYKYI